MPLMAVSVWLAAGYVAAAKAAERVAGVRTT
jgi:hypothetical protein